MRLSAGAGRSVRARRRRSEVKGEIGMEIQDQFEDVLALQDVALESESSWDDTESAAQEATVWWGGDLGWCRYTK